MDQVRDKLSIELKVSDKVFSKEIILKALYWYAQKFTVDIDYDEVDNNYIIKLKANESGDIKLEDLHLYENKLKRDLIDYSLRQQVLEETKSVRDLLLAKAFSNGEYDDGPIGDVSDPVGFNPNVV